MEGQGVYSPKEQYKQMFIEAVGKRPGSMVMWRVLDEIGFFNSPASANHHLNVPGGLLIHSLNVAKAAMELCETERFAGADGAFRDAGDTPRPKPDPTCCRV